MTNSKKIVKLITNSIINKKDFYTQVFSNIESDMRLNSVTDVNNNNLMKKYGITSKTLSLYYKYLYTNNNNSLPKK